MASSESDPRKPVVLLGAPTDVNSSWLRGAAEGPGAIRELLFCESGNSFTERGLDLRGEGVLHDAGDLDLGPDGGDFEALEAGVGSWVGDGHRVVVMGGDHAITHPVIRAHRHLPRFSILHFDAHTDLYEDYEGNPHSHASAFARILEDGLIERLVQVGIRTLNDHQREQVARYGVEVVEMRHWEKARSLELDGPVYVSFDMDVLDPAFAPGVSHREPGGASTRQVLDLLERLDLELIGADVVELNPGRDPVGVTAMTAARIVRELAGRIAEGGA